MAGDINVYLNNAESAVKSVKFASNYLGKRSLASMARDNIMQISVFVGGDIDPNESPIIAKMLEQQFASFVLLVLNNKCIVDISRYESVTDYVKHNIHNNDNNVNMLDFAQGAISTARRLNTPMPGLESAAENRHITKDDFIIMECWNTPELEVETSSLNDMYYPFKKYLCTMESVLTHIKNHNLTAAMEAGGGRGGSGGKNQKPNPNDQGGRFTQDPHAFDRSKSNKYKPSSGFLRGADAFGRVMGSNDVRPARPVNRPQQVDTSKLGLLAPTIIDVEFLLHGIDHRGMSANATPKGGSQLASQHALFGVKAMLRRIPVDQMVRDMIGAVTDSLSVFKFIKWTQGELKLRDILFNVSNYKNDARSSRTGSKWLVELKKRGKSARHDRGIMPASSIVLSSVTVDQIKAATGMDLFDPAIALKIMTKYFLLSLVIYDTSTRIISQLLHGYDSFAESNIDGVRANISRDNTVTDMTALLKTIGKSI